MVAPPLPNPETDTQSVESSPRSLFKRLRAWLHENRTGLLVLAACGFAVCTWNWWRGLSGPQRLGDIPNLIGFKGFLNGEVLSEPQYGTVTMTRLRDGATRTFVQPVKTRAPGTYRSTSRLTPTGLLYFVDENPPHVNPIQHAGGMPGGPMVHVETREVSLAEMGSAKPEREPGDYTAYLLPRSTEAKPIVIARHLNSQDLVVSGNTAYWTERRRWAGVPATVRTVKRDKALSVPILPPCDRLMRAPIGGEATPVTVTRLQMLDSAGSSGITWTELDPGRSLYPGSLLYLSNDRHVPSRLPGYRGMDRPLEYNSRLYWMQSSDTQNAISPELPWTVNLMSAPLDLSSTRREATLRIRGQFGSIMSQSSTGRASLFAHGSALYVMCAGDLAADDGSAFPSLRGGSDGPPTSLYVLALRGRTQVRKVTTFPSVAYTFYLDGDDLYGVASEDRSNWFDWSRDGLQQTTFRVAYRFHLPD
jgi:hypothetical protein